MAKHFTIPTLYGILCDELPCVDRPAAHALGEKKAESVLLPFQIERRHLKNVLACMRLMDIQGLIVQGRHRATMMRHLSHLDPLARAMGEVDTIARRGREFVGFCARALACREWLREQEVTPKDETRLIKSMLKILDAKALRAKTGKRPGSIVFPPTAIKRRALQMTVTVLTTEM